MNVPFSKAGMLKNTTATPLGFVDAKGQMIRKYQMTQEQIDSWNGVVVEEIVVEEKPKTKKRKSRKKKEETVEVQEDEKDSTSSNLLSKMFGK